LLASSQASPNRSPIEQACLDGSTDATRARQTLVILHPANETFAEGTRRLLEIRPGVHRHFHICMDRDKDLGRLARFLSNQAIGLVLAGGGARGLAHIGVFRALEEAGIPIDAVGGTSIGSVMGASLAFDWGWQRICDENKPRFLSNPTSDFNYLPFVSLLAGRKLDRILEASAMGGKDIEDLWLPFFCVSSNYTQACEHVHTRGNLKRAVMSSMAIPGVFPPVINGNDLLVDGGVFNNMPVDVMARAGVRTILAVDLRRQDQTVAPLDFDQVPGTWALLMDHLKPKARRRYRIPSMLTTLIAMATLSSNQKVKTLTDDVDLLFNPDVSQFGMLEWKSFDLLVEAGYRHARERLAKHWPLAVSRDQLR
jgi:NTE family protein